MARLIPSDIWTGCPSPGERDIFYRLKNSGEDTNDWIALHSLDLAHHVRQLSGEADFVILIPGEGVLVLEIKACQSLQRTSKGWFVGNQAKPDPRGPFRQAAEAMHSIRQRLQLRRPDLSGTLFWSAVVFPYLSFNEKSGEWHDWQVIDRAALRSHPFSSLIRRVLAHARAFAKSKGAGWLKDGEPTPQQCTEMAVTLRPQFEVFETPRAVAERLDNELRIYTAEQFTALDAMEGNPRVVFDGPAGTGKTLLAIEATRRSAGFGRKSLMLCFNRFLGLWLAEQVSPLKQLVRSGTLHSYMLGLIPKFTDAEMQRPGFWDKYLPERAAETLIENQMDGEFDTLILDEAQDLMNPAYLDFFDLALKGGLAAGCWHFFGDFQRQNIYRTTKCAADMLKARCGNVPLFSLRANCRNTPRIASLAHLLGGLQPNYSRVLRPDDGAEPTIWYYDTPQQQQILLVKALEELSKSGLSGSQIAVLSTKAGQSCAAAEIVAAPWKDRLRSLPSSKPGNIPYCSIHAFKGLEAPAVIVTDIEHVADAAAQDLFYVAVTRPLSRLVLLVSAKAKPEMLQVLLGPNPVSMKGK